jgi:hypothetical protein
MSQRQTASGRTPEASNEPNDRVYDNIDGGRSASTTSDESTGHPERQNPIDAPSILKALKLLEWGPHTVAELRVIGARHKPFGRTFTLSGYFSDLRLMALAAGDWSGRAEAVYFVLNPIDPRVRFRALNRLESWPKHTTTDDEVLSRRWLLIGLDPVRVAGVSSLDTEHSAALARARDVYDLLIAEHGFSDADLVLADSGNGGHVLLRTDMPNDEDSRLKFQAFLKELDDQFSDEHVKVDLTTHNAARICKLYGTMACKGDPDPSENPHRVSRILEVGYASG